MKRTASILAAVSLLLPSASPAFAYTANNWPGMNVNGYAPAASGVSSSSSSLWFFEETSSSSSSISSNSSASSVSSSSLPATHILTRADFTKLLVNTMYPDANFEACLGALVYKDQPDYRLLFADVSINHPQAKEICIAMRMGLVRGYSDATFRPDQPINFAETAKMLSRAYALTPYPSSNPLIAWYRPYVDAMASRNLIPQSIGNLAAPLTMGDLQEILDRLRLGITWRAAIGSDELQRKSEAAWVRAGR